MGGSRIGVDLMGSEQSPQVIFEAVVRVSKEIHPSDTLFVIARTDYISKLEHMLGSFEEPRGKIEFIETPEAVEMDEPPLLAVRRKKQSSMAVGIHLLKEGKLDAFLSTGNTGALVASAMLALPMLPAIEKPALLIMLPTGNGKVVVLDVGANISPKPEHLFMYAIMGVAYQQSVYGLSEPRVGLLNIGVEEQKGTKEVKEAYSLLQNRFAHRFQGNIEGRDVFQGKIDVLVTDGFTGNVFLKTSEGVCNFLIDYLQSRFSAQVDPQVIQHLNRQFNYSEHPGAFLCGVDGIVVKCHGNSDMSALMNGIRGAIDLAKRDILAKMKAKLG